MERQVQTLLNALSNTGKCERALLADTCYRAYFSDIPCTFITENFSHSRYHPLLCRKIKRAILQFAPAIIHAHGQKAAMLVATLRRHFPLIHCVVIVHGTKRNTRRNQRCLQQMDKVIAVSEGVREVLQPLQTVVVPNALPALAGNPVSRQTLCERWQLDSAQPILTAAGRLVALKRYDQLIAAANQAGLQL